MTPEYKAERDRALARHAEWRARLTAKETAKIKPTSEKATLHDTMKAIGRKFDRSKSIGERAKAASEVATFSRIQAGAAPQAQARSPAEVPTVRGRANTLYSLVNADSGMRMTNLGRQWFKKGEAETLAADWRNRGYTVRIESATSTSELGKEIAADKRRAKKYAADVAKEELRKANEATRNRKREEAIARAQVVAAQKRAAGEDDEYEAELIVAEKTVPHNILMQYPSGRWGFEGYVYPRLRNKTWNTVLEACEAAANCIHNVYAPYSSMSDHDYFVITVPKGVSSTSEIRDALDTAEVPFKVVALAAAPNPMDF